MTSSVPSSVERGGGQTAAPTGGSVLEVRGLSKRFGETLALADVSLGVAPGEALGLCGHNGSGKSTLIKILSGYHQPDPGGELVVRGVDVPLPITPVEAGEAGMTFVHQDLGLVDELSIIDNLRISSWAEGFARIPWSRERKRCREALREFGLSVSPDRPIGALSSAEKTIVAVVRSLQGLKGDRGGLFVFDEPTTHLSVGETGRLFEAFATLKGSGHGIIFVSHRLNEILEQCENVAVLRSGRLVTLQPSRTFTELSLAEAMVGRALQVHEASEAGERGALAVQVSKVTAGRIQNLDLSLYEGEIVGITGLVGTGFERVPYLVYGAVGVDAGSIEVDGRQMKAGRPGAGIAHGMALVPDERLRLAAAGEATVLENLTLTMLPEFSRGPLLRKRREKAFARTLLTEHDVTPPDPDLPLASLSGGNQQKVVLARALAQKPKILLLHEPTQGVDIGARNQIFERIDSAARKGMAVLIASTEYEDLAQVADRVIVMRDGAIKAVLERPDLSASAIERSTFVD